MFIPGKHRPVYYFVATVAAINLICGCTTTSQNQKADVTSIARRCVAPVDATHDLATSRQEYCACNTTPTICAPGGPLDQWVERIKFMVSDFGATAGDSCTEQAIIERVERFYFALATACAKRKYFRSALPPPALLTTQNTCTYVDSIDERACLIRKRCTNKSNANLVCLDDIKDIHRQKLERQSENTVALLRPVYQYQNPSVPIPQPCIHATPGCDPNMSWVPGGQVMVTNTSLATTLKKRGFARITKADIQPRLEAGCIVQRPLATNLVTEVADGFCYLYQLTGRQGPARLHVAPCPQVVAEYTSYFCPDKFVPTLKK